MPPPASKTHPRMSMAARAAQFSPFAALTGYVDMIEETARFTENAEELDEDYKVILQQKINVLMLPGNAGAVCEFTYFVPDSRKQGGSYETAQSSIRKIDNAEPVIILANGVRIPVVHLRSIEGEVFGRYTEGE